MSNLEKASNLASEWVDSMGGLDNISYLYGDDVSGLVQAIHDAGLLMPDLPAPEIGAVSGIPRWHVDDWSISREPNDDTSTNYVFVDHEPSYDQPYVFAPQDARLFALALLAASNHAETEEL